MKLEALRPERYPDFYRFNAEIFPTRVSVPDRFRFQIVDNPLLADKHAPDVALVAEDDGTILGQVILQPVEYHLDGTRARGFMGVDLFVKEQARNSRAGGALSFKIVRAYSPFFCVTISAAAEKVFAAVGIKTIGTMRKFLWVRGLRGLAGLAKAALGAKASLRPVVAPSVLTVGGARFTKANVEDTARIAQRPWPDGRLEFDRSPAVVAWRFFAVPDVYVTYLCDGDPSCFFVVRAANRRGLSVLSLVDFRTAPERPEAFRAILAAVKQLAASGGFDGVATATSVDAFDTALRAAWFYEVGAPVPVLANLPEPPRSLFVTMADADTDLRFDESGPIFGVDSAAMAFRIASLLPSATEIVCALGAEAELVGISHECDFPPSIRDRVVLTSSRIDATGTSGGIDAAVRAVVRGALSIYAIDDAALAALAPDVIVTQDLCEVCAVSLDDVRAAVARLAHRERVAIVSLRPTRLADVLGDVERVAAGIGRVVEGRALAATLRSRLDAIADRARRIGSRPRVATIEWIDPVMLGGTWMPELTRYAGGEAVGVTTAGEPARTVTVEELWRLRPDVVVIKPCGFTLDRTLAERATIEELRRAAFGGARVYATDGNAFFNRPGPRLVESLEILAACVHPEDFPDLARRHADVINRLA